MTQRATIRREVVSQRVGTENWEDQMPASPLPRHTISPVKLLAPPRPQNLPWGRRRSQAVWDSISILVGLGLGVCTSWLIPWSGLSKLCYQRARGILSKRHQGELLFWGNSQSYKSWECVVCLFFPFSWRWTAFSQKPNANLSHTWWQGS